MIIRSTWAATSAGTQPRSERESRIAPASADAVGKALAALFAEHYRPLVRLAALLVQDVAIAEDITQDAFAATHGAWPQLTGSDAAVSYLRRAVVDGARIVNGARVAHRCRPTADDCALDSAFSRAPTVLMLRSLPGLQREALVLRYYGELSELDTANAMGVTRAVVRRLASQGMTTLWTHDPSLTPGSPAQEGDSDNAS